MPLRRRRRTRRLTALGRALVALGTVLLATAGIAVATAPSDDPLGAMVGYVQRAQNLDGGFGGEIGQPSDPGFTAWAAMALSSAGVNPRDQRKVGGVDVYTYLVAHAHLLTVTTDYERVALVAHSAGTSLRDFGGVDLVARILERQNDDGGFPHGVRGKGGVNDTIWAVIALSVVPEPGVREQLEEAARWIVAAQNDDGGWPAVARGGPTDLDMTGAAIQALNAIGWRDTDAQREAFELLRRAQDPDGGFRSVAWDTEANTATTSWVVQGIWSAGLDPRSWNHDRSGRDPLDYLASMQRADGAIVWKRSHDLNPLWMTAYAGPAYAGHYQPLPVVAERCDCRQATALSGQERGGPPPPPANGGNPGAGGSEATDGGAALAGGGGNGSPLFSRPKPQSRGRARGGVRRVRDEKGRRVVSRAVRDEAAASRQRESRQRERERDAAQDPQPEPAASPPSDVASPDPLLSEGDDDAGTVATDDAADRAGGGGGADLPATGRGRGEGTGAGGDPQVTGTLIGGEPAEPGAGDEAAAAPGISGARAGGRTEPAIALGLGGVLLLTAGLGTQVERRRPEKEQFA